MINIYGSPRSSAGRCYWCLEEIGISYHQNEINFKDKEHKSEKYLTLNPNGKVPCLTDGNFTIWESMAINLYLAEKYQPELLGENVEQKGLVYQWSVWAIAELQVPLIDIFIQLVFVPEERRSLEVIDKARAKLPIFLAVLEGQLSNSSYLIGEEFSLADLNTFSVVSLCEHIKFELDSYPKIQAWRGEISKREAYQKFIRLCE